MPGVGGGGGERLGDGLLDPLLAHPVLPDEGLHLEQVDHALELGLRADGQLDDRGQAVEAVLDHLDAPLEVRPDAVHLVHEADARHAVLVGLAPHRLGLGLDARDGVEDRDRAVEHAQRALDLDGEVDVARACR